MQVNNINPILFRTMHETGRAMALISSDSERTFATYLGAAVDLTADDITHDIFEDYDYFYIEGYLVQNREMIEKAMRLASNANLKVCLDLASYNIVEENREFFLSLISKYVDILFANEEEIRALTGKSPEEGAMEIHDHGRSGCDQDGCRRFFLCFGGRRWSEWVCGLQNPLIQRAQVIFTHPDLFTDI